MRNQELQEVYDRSVAVAHYRLPCMTDEWLHAAYEDQGITGCVPIALVVQ